MTGKGGDYDGWILRLLDKPEDILHSFSQLDWLEFAAEKIEAATGQGITRGQIQALAENRDKAFELPSSSGFAIGETTRYRDAKGRWSKEPTERAQKFIVFRGAGEKFMSRTKADTLLQAEIYGSGARKRGRE